MAQIVYKVRHKPTGLYYRPGPANLSEKGKVYFTKNTIISSLINKNTQAVYTTHLRVSKDSKFYNKHKEVLDKCNWADDYSIFADGNDFELVAFDLDMNEIKTIQ